MAATLWEPRFSDRWRFRCQLVHCRGPLQGEGISRSVSPATGRRIARHCTIAARVAKHAIGDAAAGDVTRVPAERQCEGVRIMTREGSAISERINRSVITTTGKGEIDNDEQNGSGVGRTRQRQCT